MNITDRDINILEWLLRCGFLVTAQIRSLLFPSDKDGSVTRDRLRKLDAAGFIARRRAEVANPLTSNTVPVWIITERGICQLALRKDDASILNQKPPCTRSWHLFCHYVCVSDLMIAVRKAITAQSRVILRDTYFEHTVVNANADDPSSRYRLYTVVREEPKRIICAPDGAFELQVGSYRRAYYLELERGTDTPQRVAAKKTSGFAALAETKKWKLHFPQASDFRVLAVAPTPSWRDSLRKAVKAKPGAESWLFAARNELSVETFLHGDIVYTCGEGPRPLVRPEASPAPLPAAVVPNGGMNGGGNGNG